MKRTMHGEALQQRRGGVFAGLSPRRLWSARQVWCPRCQAAPNRKCTYVEGDQYVVGPEDKPRLKDGLRPGRQHHERWQRSTELCNLAKLGPTALFTLAFRPPSPRPPPPSTDHLPLFRR